MKKVKHFLEEVLKVIKITPEHSNIEILLTSENIIKTKI